MGIYSIDQYEDPEKWAFAIALNKAKDNFDNNPNILNESLLRFEKRSKQDWFDEQTMRWMLENREADVDKYKVKQNIIDAFQNRLTNLRSPNNLRNYFSHHFHTPDSLIFAPNDPVRIIMEQAYQKALFDKTKNLREDISIQFPEELFEENGKITSAGLVFFASFFVERRFLNRLMGNVQGFTKTEGEYKITRDLFSTYSLRDSYSVKALDHDAAMFRDILAYLSRVPTETYQRMKQPQTRDAKQLSERKTDKFISFALHYLEDYALQGLKEYQDCVFARKVIEEKNPHREESHENEHKPQHGKRKVELHFDRNKEDPFYINRRNVILRIQKKSGQAYRLRIGEYELKYLVLLSLHGKARQAIEKIDTSIFNLRNKLSNIDSVTEQEILKYVRFLPRFIRSRRDLLQTDDDKNLKARLEHVKKKWLEKKDKSKELQLHKKGRDILRYINERCETELNTDRYNRILELLVKKDLRGFYRELEELKRTSQIDKNIAHALYGQQSLNALHTNVCDLVLKELDSLDMQKLRHYIGLEPKEEKEVAFEKKLDRVKKEPVLYKGFLRYQFFAESKKSFAKLVEETIKQQWPDFDIPLGEEYYNIPSLNRFDKSNKKLYETLAMDRLCTMIARKYYLGLNEKLAAKAQRIEWKKEDTRELIVFTLQNPRQPQQSCSIRFSIWDFTKLYVIDDPEFLYGLFYLFFPKEKNLDYHNLWAEGINKYTNLQKEGIEAILELERKIIERKQITPVKNYIEFKQIMNTSGYNNDEQVALKRVRNALLHYNLNFEKQHLRTLYAVMKREGIERKWSLTV